MLSHIILQIAHLFSLLFLISSLITHGFGTPAICAALSTFQTVLSEMLKLLENTLLTKMVESDSGQGHGTSEKAPAENFRGSRERGQNRKDRLTTSNRIYFQRVLLLIFFLIYISLRVINLQWTKSQPSPALHKKTE